MFSLLYGKADKRAAAVVGNFDPVLAENEALFRSLADHARARCLSSVVVLLHPHPGMYFNGRFQWPIYDSVNARLTLIRNCGVDAVLLLHFAAKDAALKAQHFFTTVAERVDLGAIWLGANQSLGSCKEGSEAAIRQICESSAIELTILPQTSVSDITREVRRGLLQGRIEDAISRVGRPPILQRPSQGRGLRLAWAAGGYRAAVLPAPGGIPVGPTFEVELRNTGAVCPWLEWPDPAAEWLVIQGRSSA